MKAYDLLNRNFILLALQKLGFCDNFVALIARLHEATTALTVNEDLSDPCKVVSGISQGCSLAPLLFIVAAKVLALIITQDKVLQGLRHPAAT